MLVKDSKKGGGANNSAVSFNDVFSFGTENSAENELGFFKSKRLMLRVVDSLKLYKSYKIREGLHKAELYYMSPVSVLIPDLGPDQQISFEIYITDSGYAEISNLYVGDKEYDTKTKMIFGDTLKTPTGMIIIKATPFMNNKYIGKTIYFTKNGEAGIAELYNSKLQANVEKETSIILLTLKDDNPRRAEDILNTLVKVYENDVLEDKNKIVLNTAKFVNRQLSIIERDLDVVDSEIERYKKENKLTDISSDVSLYLQNTGNLDNAGLSIENKLNMAEYIRDYLADNDNINELIPAPSGIMENNGIQDQINGYNALLLKRNKLLANSSSNNPVIRNMAGSLASMRFSISRAIDNQIAVLEIQVKNLRSKEKDNLGKISSVPTQQKKVISIERQQKIKEELYLYLLQKKQENELQYAINESNCRIVDPAMGPYFPVSPKKTEIIIIALFAGLGIPVLVLYLYSVFNTMVHTKSDIKNATSVPFVGEIPMDKKDHDRDIVVSEGCRNFINESFGILCNNMDFMSTAPKSGARVIHITSFNPNSGKTFITINLAVSLAQYGNNVIVLDADLRKGSLHKVLRTGLHMQGISEFLSGKAKDSLSSVYKVSQCAGLDIMPSGALPPNPAELLKSERLEILIAELKKKYDYIIMDNPPYGVVVDTALCARVADQTVFVIRSGLFDKSMLPDLQELYASHKLHNMSVLLNAVDMRKVGYGYGYNYRRNGYYHEL
ncbi:MAG: polysaccharide biosynthesis tyrosine autokinase [Bacteroidales bacterium]|nr:polysaccharide biosynthesis tyrosine autokinase [Bacteroidales bacterium]